MTYATLEAKQFLLDQVAEAADQVGFALACLGEAYEQVDDQSAAKLEEQLFQPVQAAYGRAKRTHTDFAQRNGLAAHQFEQIDPPGASVKGAGSLIDRALSAVAQADQALSTLQDSMLMVDAGDIQFRSGVTAIREPIADLNQRAREFSRTLGR